eukprot:25065-Chlamydomonas_euryale.AAC.1
MVAATPRVVEALSRRATAAAVRPDRRLRRLSRLQHRRHGLHHGHGQLRPQLGYVGLRHCMRGLSSRSSPLAPPSDGMAAAA